jgi:hypothetical protein
MAEPEEQGGSDVGMFRFYDERPASPIVEWARYANRRATDLKTWPQKLRERAVYTVLVVAVWRLLSGPIAATNQLVSLLIAAAVSVFLAPMGQWLFHFATAPYGLLRQHIARLQRETDDAKAFIADLTHKLEAATVEKRDAITVAASLVGFREAAVHQFLNRQINNDENLARLKADIAEWEKNVIQFMERANVPVGRISTFRVLGTYRAGVKGGYNEEHRRELAMLWERMNRLLDIVQDVAV